MQIRVGQKRYQAVICLASNGGEAAIDVNCSRGGEILHASDSTRQREGRCKIQQKVVPAAGQPRAQSQSCAVQIRIGEKRYQAIVSLAAAGGEAPIDLNCLHGGEIAHTTNSSE